MIKEDMVLDQISQIVMVSLIKHYVPYKDIVEGEVSKHQYIETLDKMIREAITLTLEECIKLGEYGGYITYTEYKRVINEHFAVG